MNATAPCCDETTFQRLFNGQLPAAQAESVVQHLVDCEPCRRRADVVPDDTLGELLRNVQRLPALEGEPAGVSSLIGRVLQLRSSVCTVNERTAAESISDGSVPTPEPESAVTTFGRYRVVRILGRGGMGTVYEAVDTTLDRRVAVKVPRFAGSEKKKVLMRQRFLREARAAASVDHVGVCKIHDVGEQDGKPFVVMEFVEGESLASWLEKLNRADDRHAVALILRIAEALQEVHRLGIIHRDLKPGNILLKRDGSPKVTDFGLAHLCEDSEHLTSGGELLGTPSYMAPEQAAPDLGEVSPRTDMYSLAVILFQMLTGRLPWQGDLRQLVYQVTQKQAPAPASFRSDLDPELSKIIHKAMSRRPEDRYAEVPAFADALKGWLRAAAARAASTPAHETTALTSPRMSRSKQWQLWIAAGLTAAAVLVAGIVVIIRDKSGKETARIKVDEGGSAEMREEKENPKAQPRALDNLNPANIPAKERRDWHPKELVAIIGQHEEPGPDTNMSALAFSPDSQQLLISRGMSARLWDFATEREVWRQPQRSDPNSLGFTPNGKQVLVAGWHQRSRLLAADTGTEMNVLVRDIVNDVILTTAISPDGKQILVSQRDYHNGPTTLWVWDVATGRPLRSWRGSDSYLMSLAWLPDNRHAFSTGWETKLRLWDIQQGKEVWSHEFAGKFGVNRVACSRDGSLVASGESTGTSVILWDMEDGRPRQRATLKGHPGTNPGAMVGLALAPDGRTVVSSDNQGKIVVWDVARETKLHEWQFRTQKDEGPLLAFAPDSRHLAIGNSTATVYIFRLRTANKNEQ